MLYYVRRAVGICPKTKVGCCWVLVEMGGEMNYGVILSHDLEVFVVEDVVAGAPREIVGIKEAANVRAQITTAAGDENFHLNQINGQALGQRVQFHQRFSMSNGNEDIVAADNRVATRIKKYLTVFAPDTHDNNVELRTDIRLA